jgi:hypothetical protein
MNALPPPESALAAELQHYNTTPIADFCGLSPAQMHALLYQPLDLNSVVQLRPAVSNNVLDHVPFLRLTEAFLHLLAREQPLRLTPLGALPRKYLRELYAHGFILEQGLETGLFTLSREIDSLAITTLHQTTRLAGLARLVRGQLLLTKKGQQLRDPSQRLALWSLLVHTFTSRFVWASHDGYPAPAVGQTGWAYSVYLLARFGQQSRPASFYADCYQRAFPFVLAEFTDPAYRTPQQQFTACYAVRTFERSLNWLGLVEAGAPSARVAHSDQQVLVAPLLAQLFEMQPGPA